MALRAEHHLTAIDVEVRAASRGERDLAALVGVLREQFEQPAAMGFEQGERDQPFLTSFFLSMIRGGWGGGGPPDTTWAGRGGDAEDRGAGAADER